MRRHLVIILALILNWGGLRSAAQDFTPIVRTYDRDTYAADNQNWSVTSSDDGIVYFGNGVGLLSYDGSRWEINKAQGSNLIRAVFADGDRIYVGSHEHFGYFMRSEDGTLVYSELSGLIEGYQMRNDEIWRILRISDKIIFQSFASFFVYDGVDVKAFPLKSVCLFFNVLGDRVLTSADEYGLVYVDINTGDLIKIPDVPFKSKLVSILQISESQSVFLTYSDGLFLYDGHRFTPFRTEIDRELPLWQPNNAIMNKDGDIVIGTKLNGSVCISRGGVLKWCLNNSNVLGCNTVLGMTTDFEGNLWMAMDGGLAMVQNNPSLTYVRTITPSVGSIYTVFYRKPYIYMGTGQGLYVGKIDDEQKTLSDVHPVKEVLGNVWYIKEQDNQVFCGTNYESFELSGNNVSVASSIVGGFCQDHGNIHGKEVLVQGTYTYPVVFTKSGSRWQYSHTVSDFVQPINSLVIDDDGTIWAGHKYKGLYSLVLDDELRNIVSQKFYPSLDGESESAISVYRIKDRVVFVSMKGGFYYYDRETASVQPYEQLNALLADTEGPFSISRFTDDLYWFISSRKATLMRFDSERISIDDVIHYETFGSRIPDEDRNITPISDNECVISLGNSLALYSYPDRTVDDAAPLPVSLARVKASDLESHVDTLLPLNPSQMPEIPYRFRNITLDFRSPHYRSYNAALYRFRLDDQSWSALTPTPSVSFAYLRKGSHSVSVETYSPTGEHLSAMKYGFKVRTPFYKSFIAIILYILAVSAVVLLMILVMIRRQKKASEREKENLESQVKLKSKELAASTMHIIQKNELLLRIKKELDVGNTDKAMSIINVSLADEKEWKKFEANFDNLHAHFFRNLRQRYPALTDNDLRFCAYLRLNLSSKDIASLMNISLKGVEAARARIRRKIFLPSSQSLTAFMIDLK